MDSFEASLPGRLWTLAIALPLAVGACAAWPAGVFDAAAVTVAVFGGIVLAMFGAAAAMEERPKSAIVGIVMLPPSVLSYFPLLAIASQSPVVRVAMVVAAIALVGLVIRGALPRARHHAAVPARRVAHHLT
jgi:hypothetical protein